ncbi:hypothetical protein PPGU19_087920 (plasmid) [Paraburkholderia sp. PGU19]|uniref:hypothetical protein n=1 Tax=Paraburkholderia sp. PGU19 TaxID=2735434 RepID=UPI0015DA82DB|nr:hypothetical protein [Paraburkholderia sp. PGU19]BCG04224.1 hypothetical protein PPGU19_087920 [Paraburkholderia sp. PGU19]
MLTETAFLVLNALYLKKMANFAALVECVRLPEADVQEALNAAVENGQAMDLSGEYLLDVPGRRAVLKYYSEIYLPKRAAVTEWYERFETLNSQFLKLVSEFQTSDGDARVLAQLMKVVGRQITALRKIESDIPRYGVYADRFATAIEKVDLGDRPFVTNPRADSIHNIWFEFHEDILAVVGRPRETVEDVH